MVVRGLLWIIILCIYDSEAFSGTEDRRLNIVQRIFVQWNCTISLSLRKFQEFGDWEPGTMDEDQIHVKNMCLSIWMTKYVCIINKVHAWVLSLPLCPTLCDPVDCCPPGLFVPEILQARILEWAAMPTSRGSSWPRDQIHISCGSSIAGGFFYCWANREATYKPQCCDTVICNPDLIIGLWIVFWAWYFTLLLSSYWSSLSSEN